MDPPPRSLLRCTHRLRYFTGITWQSRARAGLGARRDSDGPARPARMRTRRRDGGAGRRRAGTKARDDRGSGQRRRPGGICARAGPTTRRAAVRAAKRNDRPPAPTPLEKILERTTGYQTTGSSKNAYAPDTHVLARCSANLGQWFGGTIVEGGEDGTCRVVFLDGAKEDVSINNIRVWDRPPLSDWHRKHQGPIKSRYVADVQSKANTHRSVLQFDLETGNLIAQFVSARRAVDNVPSLTDPQEVLTMLQGCCRKRGWLQVDVRRS